MPSVILNGVKNFPASQETLRFTQGDIPIVILNAVTFTLCMPTGQACGVPLDSGMPYGDGIPWGRHVRISRPARRPFVSLTSSRCPSGG